MMMRTGYGSLSPLRRFERQSSGPDGIPALFFQKCWGMIKSDFTKAVLSVLNSGRVLREVNRTFIALIPKGDNPEQVQDYRPISLCNIFMRIVTKCIANRMAKVMGSLVGEFQNAFLPGRLISDNILLAHEAIHVVNRHKFGKYGKFAFKADMSKAYDRVRWQFLNLTLRKFGFPENLVQLIMNCVSSVSYEVLLNGSPLEAFRPTCGLRQGDPLSLYLFILCMEVLSGKVLQAQNEGALRDIRLCPDAQPLTHLFFADDAVYFLKDSNKSIYSLKGILDAYCRASGKRINDNKSGVLFSPSTKLSQAKECLQVLNIRHNSGIGKYLGLPTEFQGSKQEIFAGLIESVSKRVSSWNGIFLSPAGRLTLVSSVLSNISNYFLSVFKIPVSVTSKINSMLAHFWWAGCYSGRRTHWCSRRFLSLPKSSGGLGLRNIECLNQALLANQAWRIISGQETLFCKVFKAKLFGREGWSPGVEPSRRNNVSWGVRSIRYGLQLILDNIAWKPGINSNLAVWNSCWVNGERPEPSSFAMLPENTSFKDLHVKDLRLLDGNWDVELLQSLFTMESVATILAIPLCLSQVHDKVFWKHTSDGIYSVKSGYGVAFADFMRNYSTTNDRDRLDGTGVGFCRKVLWKLPGPNTWKVFLWRLLTNSLPFGSEFVRRNIGVDPNCKLCLASDGFIETGAHLFRDCQIARRVWACSDLGIRTFGSDHVKIGDWIINWINYLRRLEDAEVKVNKFLATLWCLWLVHNHISFKGEQFHPQMFFGIWSCLVETALRALDIGNKERRGVEVDLCRDGLSRLREGRPFFVVGGRGGCEAIRVMVDAGWKSMGHVGIRWVAYGYDGSPVLSRGVRICAESGLQAEALGLRDVLRWAFSQRILHLEVNSDCLQLLHQIAGLEKEHHLIDGVIQDMRLLFPFFHCLSFKFVPRRFNKVAHTLAERAVSD
ncbi:uncharacterized protein LOC141632188 [Silene latifolia]|uniref:uncharacterized protein LOC141632188 n=1 Tax=Silene latifolia TaxID=37657 RepID=UPI003D785404